MDVLNSREIALLIWFSIATLFVLLKDKKGGVKRAIWGCIKSFAAPKLLIVFLSLIAYVVGLVYFLSVGGLWEFRELKSTIIWFLVFGFGSTFKFEDIRKNPSHYKQAIFDCFKLTAVIEFIAGDYTFPLYVELFLQPTLAFFVMASAIADRDEKTKIVKPFADGVLVFAGVTILGFAVTEIIKDFNQFTTVETAKSYLTPIVLTLGYLPCLLVVVGIFTYESLPNRLNYAIRTESLKRMAFWCALFRFNFRYNALYQWTSSLSFKNVTSFRDVHHSINEFFHVKRGQMLPRRIPSTLGWSPYFAIRFLSSYGLKTDYYHPTFDDEWYAQSKIIDIGHKVFNSSVDYMILGDEKSVTKLKLSLSLIYPDHEEEALNDFAGLIESLILKATGTGIAVKADLLKELNSSQDYEFTEGIYKISLLKEQGASKTFRLEVTIALL